MTIIDKNISKLIELCNLHNVKTLHVFGSALNDNFSADSDIDFLVNFKSIDLANYFSNYSSFRKMLKQLFKRDIDLVEKQSLKNPILIQSINKNKTLIYG